MPVSGVGSSGVNYPTRPPPSGVAAYSAALMTHLADIAGTLKDSEAPVSAPTAALYTTAHSLTTILSQIMSEY